VPSETKKTVLSDMAVLVCAGAPAAPDKSLQ
jgi:hypothetical protein